MRQYLKFDEKWKDWENMEMKWIQHHNPDLVVLDDNGREKERIDLQGLTASKLESMLESRGFKKPGPSSSVPATPQRPACPKLTSDGGS